MAVKLAWLRSRTTVNHDVRVTGHSFKMAIQYILAEGQNGGGVDHSVIGYIIGGQGSRM